MMMNEEFSILNNEQKKENIEFYYALCFQI